MGMTGKQVMSKQVQYAETQTLRSEVQHKIRVAKADSGLTPIFVGFATLWFLVVFSIGMMLLS